MAAHICVISMSRITKAKKRNHKYRTFVEQIDFLEIVRDCAAYEHVLRDIEEIRGKDHASNPKGSQ